MKAIAYLSSVVKIQMLQSRHLCFCLAFISFSVWMLPVPIAIADPQPDTRQKVVQMKLYTEQHQLFCDFIPLLKDKHLLNILNEGTALNFTWRFSVERQRNYWLDKDIRSFEFIRQAKPDLVSKVWILNDSQSETTHQSLRAQKAFHFLSSISHIPVIDLSSLQQGETYIITAKLNISEGELGDSWWSEAFRFGKTVAIGSFILP